MFIAELRVARPAGCDRVEFADLVADFLSPWWRSGRIASEEAFTYDTDEHVVSIVRTPERDALTSPAAVAELKDHPSSDPCLTAADLTVTILGPCPLIPEVCTCASPTAYVLWTTFVSESSPVKCFDCDAPVPLYRLAEPKGVETLSVRSWEARYRACDRLNMGCGAGERYGEGQMKKWDGPLMLEARDLAKSVAEATGRPMYVFLHRSSGARRHRRHASCPGCGEPWTRSPDDSGRFDLRCDACRIVALDA